jgi:hypothetical protein
MNKVIVIHTANKTGEEPNYKDKPEVVAKVWVDDLTDEAALEYAFRSTQNIEESWIKNENVHYLGLDLDGSRSTSVGDLMLFNGDIYRVEKYGFGLVENIASRGFKEVV